MEKPTILKIDKIVEEAKDIKTFVFNHKLNSKPGQFLEIWIPEIDEKPIGVSYQNKEKFAITVCAVGPFSREMHKLKVNDKVGIRGPYGKSFSIKKGHLVLVAGGYGAAPLAFLAEEAKKIGTDVSFILGCKSKQNIVFEKRLKKAGIKFYCSTDDGSYGYKGYSTDLLRDFIEKNHVDMVYTCGPEIMMKKVVEICEKNNINCEISLERYMKCGFGLCGSCCLDNTGWRVCKDGPVFTKEQAKKIYEFGKYKRDKSGKKVKL